MFLFQHPSKIASSRLWSHKEPPKNQQSVSLAGVCSAERPGWVFSKPEGMGKEQHHVFSALKMQQDLG